MDQSREAKLKQMNDRRKANPEINRVSVRKWQKKNKEKVLEIVKKWRKENPDKVKESYRKGYIKNKEKILARTKERRMNWTPEQKQRRYQRIKEQAKQRRIIVLTHYGNGQMICKNCGYNVFDALDLDHINNDGAKDRPKKGVNLNTFFKKLIDQGFPIGYQVLCRNCNWLKHIKNISK